MKKIWVTILVASLFSIATAHADWQSPTELVGGSMDAALKQITATLERAMISIIFALSLLQMTASGVKQMASGEMDKTFWNVGMNVTWTGIALWLLAGAANPIEPSVSNLGDLLYRMQHWVMSVVSAMTGSVEFSAGAIFAIGLQAYGTINLAVAKTMSTNAVNVLAALFVPGVSFMTALMTFFIAVVVMLSCAYLAVKVFITKIEFAILVAIAPLNAALLVFAPTREQGWAPFKGALALVYRVLILGGTVAAIGVVAQTLSDYVQGQAWGIAADVWTPLLSGAFAFALLAFVAHKSDTIASSMASGTSNLSSGDLAGSVAAGVAAGMTGAAALGAAAAATKSGTGVKAMSDVMKNLTGESPVAKGAQAMRQSLGLGDGGDKPPQRPQSAPISDKHPVRPGSDGASAPMSPAQHAGQAPSNGQAIANSLDVMPGASQPTGDPAKPITGYQLGAGNGTDAGIGGADATPQKTSQEKLYDAVGQMINRGRNLNQRIERDSAGVGVNINGHHTD